MGNFCRTFLAATFLLLSLKATPQLLNDSAAMLLVKKEMSLIYNMEFDSAIALKSDILKKYPGHPVEYLFRGLTLWWENYPLMDNNPASAKFEDDLTRCISIAEMNTDPDNVAEYLLADLCARGMLLLYYSSNDLNKKVFPLVRSTYRYIRDSFDYSHKCTDLYYYTGLYNYYRDAYAEIYPVYKPLVILFPAGDKQTGLKELERSAIESVVMNAEAYTMLAWIYIFFENNYTEALKYSKELHVTYPANVSYTSDYVKNILLAGKYDEAESLMGELQNSDNKFIESHTNIFNGILQEKKFRNYSLARQYYEKGIKQVLLFGEYGNQYAAWGYFGLSRISESAGQKNLARKYRHEAEKLAAFKKVNFD